MRVVFKQKSGATPGFSTSLEIFFESVFYVSNRQTPMTLTDGTKTNVEAYFAKEYKDTPSKGKLKYPNLPLLWVGSLQRDNYWPLELCTIEKQPAPKEKMLTENQAANMIRQTAMPPQERKKKIIESLWAINEGYQKDKFAR